MKSWRSKFSTKLALLVPFVIILANEVKGQFGRPYRALPLPAEVSELSGEPSYRAVKLRWKYLRNPEASGFMVRVCELSIWNVKTRCRERHLSLDSKNLVEELNGGDPPHHDTIEEVSRGRYEAVMNDLRMTTNYTFTVVPDDPIHPEHPEGRPVYYSGSGNLFDQAGYRPQSPDGAPPRARSILVHTMGFSARASRCLSNTSDVVVNTGPYFNGKIAVEDTLDDNCAVYGNKSSDQNVYTLRILHSQCGSKTMNNSRIETNIIVHENKDIVTHNSKRFLVVCNFLPETFTIQATVNMRKNLRKASSKEVGETGSGRGLTRKNLIDENDKAAADPNELFTYDNYRQHHVGDDRILAEQTARMGLLGNAPQKTDSQLIGQMSLLILLVVACVVGCGVAIWWFVAGAQKRTYQQHSQPHVVTTITSASTCEKDVNHSPDTYVRLMPEKDQLVLANVANVDHGVTSQPGVLRVNVCGTPMTLMSLRAIGDSEA